MTAPVLPGAATDPAGYVHAVCDWVLDEVHGWLMAQIDKGHEINLSGEHRQGFCEACANATLMLCRATYDTRRAEVALWRGIAERHDEGLHRHCSYCRDREWPCPDLLAAVAACRAYAGGA